jgi:hypothetical protein
MKQTPSHSPLCCPHLAHAPPLLSLLSATALFPCHRYAPSMRRHAKAVRYRPWAPRALSTQGPSPQVESLWRITPKHWCRAHLSPWWPHRCRTPPIIPRSGPLLDDQRHAPEHQTGTSAPTSTVPPAAHQCAPLYWVLRWATSFPSAQNEFLNSQLALAVGPSHLVTDRRRNPAATITVPGSLSLPSLPLAIGPPARDSWACVGWAG